MTSSKAWWIALVYARNAGLLILVAGAMPLRLSTTKGQGLKFKYTDKWLAKGDKRFLFGKLTFDHMSCGLTSDCIIWTTSTTRTSTSVPGRDSRSIPSST